MFKLLLGGFNNICLIHTEVVYHVINILRCHPLTVVGLQNIGGGGGGREQELRAMVYGSIYQRILGLSVIWERERLIFLYTRCFGCFSIFRSLAYSFHSEFQWSAHAQFYITTFSFVNFISRIGPTLTSALVVSV